MIIKMMAFMNFSTFDLLRSFSHVVTCRRLNHESQL